MNVSPYDFTKPIRLPADWINRLSGWFATACTQANRSWAKQLPVPIEVSAGPLDTAYAQAGLAKLPSTVVAYRVLIAGGQLPTLLVLPRLLLLQIIGVMLGEKSAVTEDRELSVVEENLADYFLVQLWLPFFRESWPSRTPGSLGVRRKRKQSTR